MAMFRVRHHVFLGEGEEAASALGQKCMSPPAPCAQSWEGARCHPTLQPRPDFSDSRGGHNPLSGPSLLQFLAVSTDYKSLKKDRPNF